MICNMLQMSVHLQHATTFIHTEGHWVSFHHPMYVIFNTSGRNYFVLCVHCLYHSLIDREQIDLKLR